MDIINKAGGLLSISSDGSSGAVLTESCKPQALQKRPDDQPCIAALTLRKVVVNDPSVADKNGAAPALEPMVALLKQEGPAITALPADYHSITDVRLPQRSVAPDFCPGGIANTRSESPVSIEQRRLLACYLQVPIDISSKEEFIRVMGYSRELSRPWIVKHTRIKVLQSMLTAEFISKHDLKTGDLPEAALTGKLALECLKKNGNRWHYDALPSRLKKDRDFNQRCLETSVLPAGLVAESGQSLRETDYAALVDMDPDNLKYVPAGQQSYGLCAKAINRKACAIEFVNPSSRFYQQLCLQAIKKDKYAYYRIPKDQITEVILSAMAGYGPVNLASIPEHLRSYEYCCTALADSYQTQRIPARIFREHPELVEQIMACHDPRYSPGILKNLPDELKTEAFCHGYLSKWPQDITGCPQSWLNRHPEWVKKSLRYGGYNLEALPESWRSFDLCQRAIATNDPWLEAVPVHVLEEHPGLLLSAAERTFDQGLSEIPDRLRTLDICCAALAAQDPVNITETMALVPDAVRRALPYDLLLAIAPGYLPLEIRKAMVANGDTTLPPVNRQELIKPVLHRNNLLEPQEQFPFSEPKFTSSVFLKKVLLSARPFNLRNRSQGDALRQAIQQHYQQRVQQLNQGMLPRLSQGVPGASIIYGGRTLMVDGQDGTTRMKFLRKGESLADFFREEAVHHFVYQHDLTSLLESEVPMPVGVKLLAIDQMPVEMITAFRSEPERITLAGQTFYLVYEFTTRNRDYSTLAYQKESNGSCTRAEQGLIRACHDLGVWSSLGAVHVSTIEAYHNFTDNRRELFLCFMFNSARAFPGALTGWDSRAINESDWGYSGLRDIGDMEFYPWITSYFDAKDASAMVPAGFDQRAAFMNAFCENMIAAVLHYACMHRDDPDYHYKNVEGREKLGAFIDRAIAAYLSGIMGRPVKTEACFESPEIYRQWLDKTTAETTLWTARQHLNSDCFARSLEQAGCYPAEVYPYQKESRYRYPEDFTSNHRDNLGNNHGQFGLTLLVRGLYQVAAVLTFELGTEKGGVILTDSENSNAKV